MAPHHEGRLFLQEIVAIVQGHQPGSPWNNVIINPPLCPKKTRLLTADRGTFFLFRIGCPPCDIEPSEPTADDTREISRLHARSPKGHERLYESLRDSSGIWARRIRAEHEDGSGEKKL